MFETVALITIVVVAAFIQGLTGFGFGLIALPLLGLFLPLKMIIPLIIMLALFISLTLSIQLRHAIDWKKITALSIATLPGIPLGIYILQNLPAEPLALSLGLVMVSFTSYQLLATPKTINLGLPYTLSAGFACGVLTASISTGGPPVIIYAAMQPWSKDQAKATVACFFFISGFTTVVSHAISGLITTEVLYNFTISLPALILGIFAGTFAYKRMSDHGYKSLALILVFLLGGMMIFENI